MIVRDAAAGDLAAIADIYGHHVSSGCGTFEETAPDAVEMGRRLDGVRRVGLPWLVAVIDARVAGYAYAAPFRTRSAYRHTVEDSVYVHPDRQGAGVGRALLQAVIARCEAMGLRQMTAVIGDSGNARSIALHQACGFEFAGVLRGVGFKHGRWVDAVMMQRSLNAGDATPPDGDGWLAATEA